MTTASYCTRCGALVVRDKLGTWVSLERRYEERGPSATVALEECCTATQEHHRPEADESYRGPRDFAAEERVIVNGCMVDGSDCGWTVRRNAAWLTTI